MTQPAGGANRRRAACSGDERRRVYHGRPKRWPSARVASMSMTPVAVEGQPSFHPQCLRGLHPQCADGGHDTSEHAYAKHEDRVAGQQRDLT